MNEESDLKKSLIKHMVYNICSFAVILFIFAIVMFVIIQNVTYSKIDEELMDAKEELIRLNEHRLKSLEIYNLPRAFANSELYEKIQEKITNDIQILSTKVSDPRINMVVWNSDGNIIIEFGRISEYDTELVFDKNLVDIVYSKNIAGKYNYRVLNFILEHDQNGNIAFCQLLMNVDTESYLVKSYSEIIISVVVISIICSIIMSYILSKNTIKPIAINLRKHTEFIQNASHELRTPLTIIQAKQELLLSEPDAKIIDKIEDISITLEETKRLTKLTKDLLTLTRADNKSMALQKELTNIDEFINNIVKNYVELAEMQNKTINIDLKYGKDIKVDRTKIHQLMVILIDNAIKYTEDGDKIDINTYLKDGKCIIEVKDTGIGVSEEGLTRIFERFYRDDKARNRETGGTGLGLSIASTIVKAHNGNIKAMHNNPKGTIFIIKLSK